MELLGLWLTDSGFRILGFWNLGCFYGLWLVRIPGLVWLGYSIGVGTNDFELQPSEKMGAARLSVGTASRLNPKLYTLNPKPRPKRPFKASARRF